MKKKLEQYKKIVEFLGNVLGENCEIVLQDLCTENQGIIAIANNKVSNRHVGAPLTDYALRIMKDGSWKEKDFECNYRGMTQDGKILRSSTFYIKENSKLIGMLCINIDNQMYYDCCNLIMKVAGFSKEEFAGIPDIKEKETNDVVISPENLRESIPEMISAVVSKYQREHGDVPADHLSQEDRLNIVSILEKNNTFLLKGAIDYTARAICCSEASVYRYLTKITKNNK